MTAPTSRLRRDLSGLCFLIGQLPREEGIDVGVRATVDHRRLAGPSHLRHIGPVPRRCQALLKAMADAGTLMRVDDEYRLQTTEGAIAGRHSSSRPDRHRQSGLPGRVQPSDFANQAQTIVGRIKATQGDPTARSLLVHEGQSDPPASESIVIWVRDGWAARESAVLSDLANLARTTPPSMSTCRGADELKNRTEMMPGP